MGSVRILSLRKVVCPKARILHVPQLTKWSIDLTRAKLQRIRVSWVFRWLYAELECRDHSEICVLLVWGVGDWEF